MGLIINKLADTLSFTELLTQLGIKNLSETPQLPIHIGGPVETGRRFILHSSEYNQNGTIEVTGSVSLTATIDILKDIAQERGPEKFLLALGYAGWGAGQLDGEMQKNAWLHVPADPELTFSKDNESKWEEAIAKIGVNPSLLSGEAGHA